jgi:hypothetical protein
MTTHAGTYVAALLLLCLVQEPVRATPSNGYRLGVSNTNLGSGLTRQPSGILHPPTGDHADGVALKGSSADPPLQAKPVQPEPPKIAVTCVLHNHPYDLVNAQTGKVVEHDDWRVQCTVTWKKDKVYDAELTLARPTEFRDAMFAVDEFRTKRAPQLVKEWEDAAKRK